MPRLTRDQRLQVTTLSNDARWSVARLSEHFQVDRRTVQRLLAKHRETNTVEDKPHQRRPKATTPRQDRLLVRMSAVNPRLVARDLQQRWSVEYGVQASTSTVKRRLRSVGLHGRIAKRKPLLTARHRATRLLWAQERQHWTPEQWRRCIFTDESPVHLVNSRQRRYVRRRGGTAMQPQHIRPTVHASSGKLEIWGGFTYDGLRPLACIQGRLNAMSYCELLQEHLLPLDLPGNNLILQQDNATCHSARVTQRFLQENHIEVLPWPPQSPDLNPIENLWSQLQQEVDKVPVQGMNGLWAEVQRQWQRLDPQVLRNLIDSMPRRVEQVIAARGNSIPY